MVFTLGSIFNSLDMNYTNGLTDSVSQSKTVFQEFFFSQVKEKLGIDAVFFLRDAEGIPKIPMIYFSAMDSYDSERIAELHRLSWNTGEAPLLFVVLPDQLLVYNNYELPSVRNEDGSFDNTKGLLEIISVTSSLEQQRKQLQQYHRIELESGEFWRNNKRRFNVNTRVDVTLINSLKVIRRILLTNLKERVNENKLDSQQCSEIVHCLLGRSILIKYLEERTDSNNNSVFPLSFFDGFLAGATEYTDVLANKDATYKLFDALEEKFNGDLFPVLKFERDLVSCEDLLELQQFLSGTSDYKSNQLALWPLYSFNAIPIQLISSIYELFFHLAETDPDEENGTYYTPYHLVEMLMDEVLPWEGEYKEQKILDPSCGSGVFLVEAYRRLVSRWIFNNRPATVTPNELIQIMQSCIYGVDSNLEAIRVASFSLSLSMCDFLEPRTIWDKLQFPRLLHYNLFQNDFFDHDCSFERNDYALVIGNPPWESKLTPAAQEYIIKTGHHISDKQIAQAFAWKAGELCENGTICLLLPSKSFLFNRSNTARQFRKEFFCKYDVSVILNYSAFRWVLFEHAVSPAVGIVYSAAKPDNHEPIFYCTPKPLYTIEDRRSFLVEPSNICRIPRNYVPDDLIWKVAMWGNPRDLELVHTIQASGTTFRVLFEQNGFTFAEGFKRGNRRKQYNEYLGMPMLNARSFSVGMRDPDSLPKMVIDRMECTVERNSQIFKAPHLIIKQSHKGSRFLADVLEYDAVFNHSFLGVHGDEQMLKYSCLLISSKVFAYYQMMTNRRWLVERDELEAGDILDMPIPLPNDSSLQEAEELFSLYEKGKSQDTIDQFIYRQYGLYDHEIALIDDAINYVYDFFSKKGSSKALLPPDDTTMRSYYDTLEEVLKNTIGGEFKSSCYIYKGNTPLSIAIIDFSHHSGKSEFQINTCEEEIDAYLMELDKQLVEARSGSVFVRRNVRIYDKNSICIVKPNQVRYWNYSSACRDADEIYADVMRAWEGKNE